MILTHFLALMAAAQTTLMAEAATLPLSATAAGLTGGRVDPALLPRLKLRRDSQVLPVRGD
jgi:hypothetical protein